MPVERLGWLAPAQVHVHDYLRHNRLEKEKVFVDKQEHMAIFAQDAVVCGGVNGNALIYTDC